MTRRLLLPLLLLNAHVALADAVPAEVRSQTRVSQSRGEVRPEPPRPREERRQSCVLVRATRPTTPRAAAAVPSFIDAEPVVTPAWLTVARRLDDGSASCSSETPSGPSPSRAPPLA